jgi:DNA-binding MarR family transcriptional regulator
LSIQIGTKNEYLTKEQLLFLHLLLHNNQRDQFVVNDLITEKGIQNCLDCTLGLISRLLSENEKKGYIFRTKSKIIENRRKQNVFFLTDEGLKKAMAINKMLIKFEIDML